MSPSFELVVFDWDGTLIDSEAKIVACMQAAMQDSGLPVLEPKQIRNVIGLGMRETLEALYPGISERDSKHMIDHYRLHFFAGEHSAPFVGVPETLATMSEHGYFMAVATGKGRNGLNKALEATGFKRWFHATRTADETRSKPHPQMLEEILDQLAVSPDKALMVGDTEFDLEMAHHAGMASVAVSYGVHELERLQAWNPLTCIHTMPELLDWLNSN